MEDAIDIRLPADQEGTRAVLTRWLKTAGEAVLVDEPVAEVETDKVMIEVAAPAAGVLAALLKQPGDEVEPGEVIARLTASESLAPAEASEPKAASAPGPASTDAPEAGAASAPGPASAEAPESRAAFAPESAPAEAPESRAASAPDAEPAGARPKLSPAVRRRLEQHAIDPGEVTGSGRGGRITVRDVERLLEQRGRPGAGTAPPPARTIAAESAAPDAGLRRVPLSPMRRKIADHMVESLLHTAPHVTSVFECDMSAVLAHRTAARGRLAGEGVDLTITAYFVCAAALAMRTVPEVNSRYTEDHIEIYDAVHVGVATALGDQGLVVPVVRDAESKTLLDVARELQALKERARARKITAGELTGGTFSISNHGVSGSLLAAPIVINQPQSAILGIGKLRKQLTVVDIDGEDAVRIVPQCYVTLTIDHRVLDADQCNRWLTAFVGALEHWPAES